MGRPNKKKENRGGTETVKASDRKCGSKTKSKITFFFSLSVLWNDSDKSVMRDEKKRPESKNEKEGKKM